MCESLFRFRTTRFFFQCTPINLKPYLIEQLAESFNNNNNVPPEKSYDPVRKILILGSRDMVNQSKLQI